jgi:Zn-dependent peptidase ImmA (M78 family)
MTEMRARKLAIDTRLRLGLQTTEYFDVYRAILSLGITCIKRPLESRMSGATIKTNRTQTILVNSSKSLGHQNFTIAHEIYHCIYDKGLQSRVCSTENFGKGSGDEELADLFAVHLLMPQEAIVYQLSLQNRLGEKLGLTDIINLEQYFGVSRKAMRWRLEELKLISSQESDRYATNIIKRARLRGRDTQLYEATKDSIIISDYAEKAKEALDKGLITESRYGEILADAGIFEEVMGETEEADIVD